MLKKLSLLLSAVALCVNTGIVAPVSAQAATEETVLFESNFQNCNLGTYTAANQMDGETDLRNGVVMANENALTPGYKIKKGDTYVDITEADIVYDGEEKVLRLNTFLKPKADYTSKEFNIANTTQPVIEAAGKRIPENTKVKIDVELKMTRVTDISLSHSTHHSTNDDRRFWRFYNAGSGQYHAKAFYNTSLAKAYYDRYNKHTVIHDPATGKTTWYVNDQPILLTPDNIAPPEGTAVNRAITKEGRIYLRKAQEYADPGIVYYNGDSTTKKIDSIANPEYAYIKSLKMTTYTDTALESVTPANESSVMTPKEAVFTFNNEVKSVATASVYSEESGETVDVTSSLIVDGKTVKVPYAFEDEKNYEVKLTGVSDGLTSADAATKFKAEVWKFSNLTENPVNTSPVDKNVYFIDEDFTKSNHDSKENIIDKDNKAEGMTVELFDDAEIVELGDGNKVYQVDTTGNAAFHIQFNNKVFLDDTATLSFDLYREEGTVNFTVDRYNAVAASWYLGLSYVAKKPMTEGEWHNVVITFTEKGTTVYVDGEYIENIPKSDTYLAHEKTNIIRLITRQGKVKIDNLKLYLDKSETTLTGVAPAYDATGVKASTPLEFTYNETIGDVSDAKLTVKPSDTNEATVLTNGNGMSVNVENNTVKVVLDNALNANLGYAVELSGLKDTLGGVVSPVITKFSTVADDEWTMTGIDSAAAGRNSKAYSFKLKHQGDAKSAQFIVATYNNDGSLSNVALSQAKTVGNSWTDFAVNAEYSANKTTKLFVWDSASSLKPIFDVILK